MNIVYMKFLDIYKIFLVLTIFIVVVFIYLYEDNVKEGHVDINSDRKNNHQDDRDDHRGSFDHRNRNSKDRDDDRDEANYEHNRYTNRDRDRDSLNNNSPYTNRGYNGGYYNAGYYDGGRGGYYGGGGSSVNPLALDNGYGSRYKYGYPPTYNYANGNPPTYKNNNYTYNGTPNFWYPYFTDYTY